MANLHLVNLLWFLHCFAAASPVVTPDDRRRPLDSTSTRTARLWWPRRIDGAGPFRFLVDTGSSHSAVGDALARRLGLQAVAKAEIMSAAGQSMRPVVRLGRTAVGAAARDGILASVLPSAELASPRRRRGRRAGAGLSRRTFDYTLDYRARSIDLDRGRGDERACRAADAGARGRPLSRGLPQGAGRGVVRLVPDTGSAALVIFGEGSGRRSRGAQTAAGERQARLRGVVGERTVERAFVQALRVGELVMHNEPAVVDRNGPAVGGRRR